MKRSLAVVACGAGLLATACSSDGEDLRDFVRNADKNLPRKIEPLPAVKPFEPFAYAGFELPDPFRPRKAASRGGGGPAPDLNRRREPLEAFPLDQLRMVGTLERSGELFALIRADRTLYRVSKGNYLGQNFGQITEISEAGIKMKEIVQDGAGDWAERQASLSLIDDARGDRK